METKTLTASATADRQYQNFMLGQESDGIARLKIREIIRLTDITTVPQMPSSVRGVINLRGKIVPVADLRVRFGLADTANSQHTCIVVVQATLPTEAKVQTRLVVDSVGAVANVAPDEIENAPEFGGGVDTRCILGMAKVKGVVKMQFDIDRVVTAANPDLRPLAEGRYDEASRTRVLFSRFNKPITN